MAPYVSPLSPIPTGLSPKIQLKFPVRAVMFDVYGTLFISASGDISIVQKNSTAQDRLIQLLNKYAIALNPSQLSDAITYRIQADHKVKKTAGVDFPEVEVDAAWKQVLGFDDIETARRFAVEYEMIVNPVWPMPRLTETLNILKKNGILMGIISNAQFFTPHLFALFCENFPGNLGFDPDLIFYSYAWGHAKPSPFLFGQAASQLTAKGLQNCEVIYVGNDMRNDIVPAHAAGFQTCLFAGDSRSLRLREDHPECRAIEPDAIINNLIQLSDVIG